MQTSILLAVAREIAGAVAVKIQQSSNLGLYTATIGKGGDQTKRGDQIVEDELRACVPAILSRYDIKNCLVISEETGQWIIGDIQSGVGIFMIIDPIDGSK